MGSLTQRVAGCVGVTLVHCCVFACAQVGQSAQGAADGAYRYLSDVKTGRNAAQIALGAGDAGVMDAGAWVVPCG